jgi:hypothetical protein
MNPAIEIEPVKLPYPTAWNGAALGNTLVYHMEPRHLGLARIGLDGAVGGTRMLPFLGREDPRLCRHEGRMYVSCSCPQYAGRVDVELRALDDLQVVGLFKEVGGLKRQKREKNWIPFSWEDKMLYVYGVQPHRILAVAGDKVSLAWESGAGGELRLSTTPVRMGDYFLSTWHTAKYDFGFYTFAARPPFEVLSVGRAVLTARDSTEVNRRTGRQCLFPLSMESRGDKLVLYGGDNDQRVVRITIPLGVALESLEQSHDGV